MNLSELTLDRNKKLIYIDNELKHPTDLFNDHPSGYRQGCRGRQGIYRETPGDGGKERGNHPSASFPEAR